MSASSGNCVYDVINPLNEDQLVCCNHTTSFVKALIEKVIIYITVQFILVITFPMTVLSER